MSRDQASHGLQQWHSTTIIGVRRGDVTVIAGDGQVSMGNTVMKPNAKKVRRIGKDGHVVAGFAGATADAFTLFERLEKKLEPALAVGAAAQPALKSLIAGLQMALTQPLRLGDMIKVDGESGRVEEIRMSFVTVRTWDERLLIVPTSRFLDESFENWSRVSERLTGPVFLHLDPATEIAPVRAEFERFVAAQAEWDQRTAELVMTEARPESIELRMSVSAATIGDLWTLRAKIREHMLDWLRRESPGALIRHRLEVEAANQRSVTPPAAES